MAKRYSGNLQISVVYDDKNHYRTAVSSGGKLLWRGIVNPAPAGFGPGVGYDSSQAYDEVASSALAFADHDVGGISDEAEYDDDLTGFLIRRSPRGKSSGHAMKKTTLRYTSAPKDKISVRKIGARWQPVHSDGSVVRGTVYNADGTGYATKEGAAEAAALLRQIGCGCSGHG
jgi:hypothetical protein